MPEQREFEWPWENPNWIVGPENKKDSAEDDNENDTPKNTGFDDTKEPVKDPPQYTVESAEIVVPEEGLKEGLPYRFKGKVRRLDNVPPANARISAQAIYRYKDKEQATGNPLLIEINKESLEFEGTIEELYEPNAYNLDKDKPVDAKYRLLVKLRGECLDKDCFSPEVELPQNNTHATENKAYFLWAFELKPDAEDTEKKKFKKAIKIFNSWKEEIALAKELFGKDNVFVRGADKPATYADFQKAFSDKSAVFIIVAAHGWPVGGCEMVNGSHPFYPENAKALPNLKLLVLESCFQGKKDNRKHWAESTGINIENIVGWIGLDTEVALDTAIAFNEGKGKNPNITNPNLHSLREAIKYAAEH